MKAYDYVLAAWTAKMDSTTGLKRIMRRLVREAVLHGYPPAMRAEAMKRAQRIAKELIP